MTTFVDQVINRQGVSYYESNVTKMIACSGAPATYSDATTLLGSGGNKLGEVVIDATDVTIQDGVSSGDRATFASQTITIDGSIGSETLDHIAVVDDNEPRLLLVTPLSATETVTGGQSIEVQSFDDEIADAA